MRELLFGIWILVQLVIGSHLVTPLVLYCFSQFRKRRKIIAATAHENDFAVIVTAYEQTTFLPNVVQSLLQMNYSNYLVYIVADNCDISRLNFMDEKIVLLRPEQTIASNTGSHFYAINHFKREHTHLTIIDSDNLVDPSYLKNLNNAFLSGAEAVQGLRSAKNLNTTYACLDAARDIYYHFYDGRVNYNAGSSATLAGSGMGFTTKLYKSSLGHLNISGAGFDKVLQYQVVNSGVRIHWCEEAVVYDEKTADSEQLVKQRARWINTWFRYFAYGFKLFGKGIVTANLNQLIFGFILLRPPLFIFLILSVIFMIADIFIQPSGALLWAIALFLFVSGFALALVKSNTDKRIYKSLAGIPKFMFFQVLSLTKIRKANKYSVATRHSYRDEPATK